MAKRKPYRKPEAVRTTGHAAACVHCSLPDCNGAGSRKPFYTRVSCGRRQTRITNLFLHQLKHEEENP